MVKNKTKLEAAAGKLITAIQKEWHEEAGEPEADISEDVMDKGHDILQAAKNGNVYSLLNELTVKQYLGESWVDAHPNTHQSISDFVSALNEATD